jgi:anti-sigma B factor antagonist
MNETLQLDVERLETVGVLDVSGYINNVGGEHIADACNGMIDEGVHRFLLDLSGCKIVNSIGISILIEIIEKSNELGGKLGFCCVTPVIAKTFRIMGLLRHCTIHDSREEGLQEVSS